MALTLTDEIIRNRVNLQHDNLEDVKALSLPGTYHEKVVSLGNSLRKFTRLKNLDLSRNAVTSLQGLEHLKMLEKLNLYYNCIEDFNELKRLRANGNLKELDLRLNPITRTEPDYRLYMIHMLPNLQKLDDRGVRDRERHAALTHFSTSQATEMTEHDRTDEEQQRVPNPRAEFVKDMGKGVSTLDDDDVAVLDLIARTGGDLGKARQITGSSARQPTAEDYSLEVLKSMSSLPEDDRPVDLEGNLDRQPVEEQDDVRASFKKKYPNIPSVTVTSCHGDGQKRPKDTNLMYEDEAEAYNKYKSHGYFTKNPGAETEEYFSHVPTERDAHPSMPEQDAYPTKQRAPPQMFQKSSDDQTDGHKRSYSVPVHRLNDSMEDLGIQQNGHHMEGQRSLNDEGTVDNSQVPVAENQRSRDFLFKLLDVVDRYWNGSKSLHKNVKFKVIAYGLIDNLAKKCEEDQQFEKEYIQGHLSKIKEENKRLKQREEEVRKSAADHSVNESHLKASLHEAYKEVEKLKEDIHKYATENREIQKKLQGFQDSNYHHSIGAASVSTVQQSHLDDLQRQNDVLKNEILLLQARHKQFGQLQDLASMLQESHKSLVKTNDHLLKDINDLKRRHHHEVEQLNWSYDQLKKTMNYLPSTSRDNISASAVLYDSNT